jgi:hypothetical protein
MAAPSSAGRSGGEHWVRPPVVARELPSSSTAKWRFRVLAVLLLAVVVFVVVKVFLQLSDVTGGEDPGIGGLPPVRAPLVAQQVPAAR